MNLSTLSTPPSEIEAVHYYAGLPSRPVLVARTSTAPWHVPTGPEAYLVPRELRPVGHHALKEVWEDNLVLKVHDLLDSMRVNWTSIDVLRIGNAGQASAPVILWIGVTPKSLSGNDGVVVASRCQDLLASHQITDVNVEIRESIVSRGAQFLAPTHELDRTAPYREPLTLTLGISICAPDNLNAEGTGGFFVSEGGSTSKLFLVTARHVLFGQNDNETVRYRSSSQRRRNVAALGTASFAKYEVSLSKAIQNQDTIAREHRTRITKLGVGAVAVRARYIHELGDVEQAKMDLSTLSHDVTTQWNTLEKRILGHVVLSPPIKLGAGSEGYTEDWAVIEVDVSKVNESNFIGNVIDLKSNMPREVLTSKMYPGVENSPSFEYPQDGLFALNGTIPDEEMREPRARDQSGEPCMMVIKRGKTTGLTVGRANDIMSYTRVYVDGGKGETSKEWAILPFDSDSGPFSKPGDSGSVIADGLGRMGGLLAGGSGLVEAFDITYATPIDFLVKRMHESGFKANLNPVLAVG
ncbi:hypothetical protein B0H11DRAFT_2160733 [Mycena galericulata]|nr:hypothetical protein B0H11DRAFT_2160733 [Mycena galericulata]